MHKASTMTYVAILGVMGVCIILTNSLVVFLYLRLQPSRKNSTNFFLFNQALIDLFNGIVLNSVAIAAISSSNKWSEFAVSLLHHYSTLLQGYGMDTHSYM